VLAVGGLLTFSTLGPDTLKELRAAFGPNDPHPRTLRFVDMHDVGDLLVALGFADPVMDMEMLTLTYPGADALFRDLRWTGARNALRDRQRGLTGRRRWERVATALESSRTEAGIPITWEVVYGHAWKAEPTRTDEGHPIVRFTRRPRGG
jgi:malonyl-CoA O-methyltransferase